MTVDKNQLGYVSPIFALEGHWEKPFEELPGALQCVAIFIGLDRAAWNAREAQERKRVVEYFDVEHNPEREHEGQRAWAVWCEYDEVKRQIDELERAATPTALDIAARYDRLPVLRQRLKELEAQLDGHGEPPTVEGTQANDAGSDPLANFRKMSDLTAHELTLTFVAGDRLQVSARGSTRRVPLAVLGLTNRNKGGLNKPGGILLGMAGGRGKTLSNDAKTSQAISRLRDVFKTHLGIKADPFDPYRKGAGWEPHFKIRDNRDAADERAKREAQHQPYEDDRPYSNDDNDATADWLEKNDPGHKT